MTMGYCRHCHGDVEWRQRADGSYEPPCNPDGTRHDCPEGRKARAKSWAREHWRDVAESRRRVRDYVTKVAEGGG